MLPIVVLWSIKKQKWCKKLIQKMWSNLSTVNSSFLRNRKAVLRNQFKSPWPPPFNHCSSVLFQSLFCCFVLYHFITQYSINFSGFICETLCYFCLGNRRCQMEMVTNLHYLRMEVFQNQNTGAVSWNLSQSFVFFPLKQSKHDNITDIFRVKN